MTTNQPTPLKLPGLDIELLENVVPDPAMCDALVAETAWRQESVRVFGKLYPQPRLVAWHGDANAIYTYAGLRLEPKPWTPRLSMLREIATKMCDADFNSVLLNYYRDGRDSMGLHSDDESELGPNPIIASFTFGSRRQLLFQHKHDNKLARIRLMLPSGSLLIMRGKTQQEWKHGIEKTRKPCGRRVNLTYRFIMPESA